MVSPQVACIPLEQGGSVEALSLLSYIVACFLPARISLNKDWWIPRKGQGRGWAFSGPLETLLLPKGENRKGQGECKIS